MCNFMYFKLQWGGAFYNGFLEKHMEHKMKAMIYSVKIKHFSQVKNDDSWWYFFWSNARLRHYFSDARAAKTYCQIDREILSGGAAKVPQIGENISPCPIELKKPLV